MRKSDRIQSNSDMGKKRRMRILLLLLAVFLIWAGYTWHTQSSLLADKKKELEQVEGEIHKLEEEKDILEYEVKKLHDDEYIAELARKYHFLTKSGEIIFVVPE